MSGAITLSRSFRPKRDARAPKGKNGVDHESSRVPRISRLMALAIYFDQLIREGVVADQADLARLGYISRARVTQIMNLLNLAPDIQEEILFLQTECHCRTGLSERLLRPTASTSDWNSQRQIWCSGKQRRHTLLNRSGRH